MTSPPGLRQFLFTLQQYLQRRTSHCVQHRDLDAVAFLALLVGIDLDGGGRCSRLRQRQFHIGVVFFDDDDEGSTGLYDEVALGAVELFATREREGFVSERSAEK